MGLNYAFSTDNFPKRQERSGRFVRRGGMGESEYEEGRKREEGRGGPPVVEVRAKGRGGRS